MPVDRPEKRMKITNGESVILVLHTPREKLLGLLDEINQSGVFVRAIDLEYFDDWCRSIVNEEPYLPMSDYFIPMWRVERMSRDEGSPSLADLFEQRTGRSLGEF
jgi:hypothetical protein